MFRAVQEHCVGPANVPSPYGIAASLLTNAANRSNVPRLDLGQLLEPAQIVAWCEDRMEGTDTPMWLLGAVGAFGHHE